MPALTVVVPFRNGFATLARLLDSLPDNLSVIIVDDLSEPPLVVDTDDPDRENVKVIRRETRGYFAGAVNTGIESVLDSANPNDVLVLNQDVWFDPECDFWKLIKTHREKYALIGDGVLNHPAFPKGYVQGTAMFMRRDAIERVGGLNVKDYPLWGCTAEWQLRACRAGFLALPVRAQAYGMHHARGDAPYGSSIAQTLRDESDKQSLYVRTPPAISVIITSFNYGRFLQEAVASLVGGQTALGELAPQTFQSFEIVIVDDCSTDNTSEVGEQLADSWKGIHFVRLEKNVGSAAAMNAGIAASFGKWIAPLDADDLMESTRLEQLYRAAVENPHRVIYDDCTEFASDAATLEQSHPRTKGRSEIFKKGEMYAASFPMPEYDFERILERNGMHKGILYERSAWKDLGGYPEEFRDGREDWAINVGFGVKGYCGVHVREPLYLRRHHGENRHLRNTTYEWRQQFVAQLHARYPHIYAGERPMGCCGNKSNGKSGAHAGSMSMKMSVAGASGNGRFSMLNVLPGQGGFVLVEYLLGRSGTQSYIGNVSHAQYLFGGKRTQGYVDPRDLDALLKLVEGRQQVFRVAPTAAIETTKGDGTPVGGTHVETHEVHDDVLADIGEQIEEQLEGDAPEKTFASMDQLLQIVAPRESGRKAKATKATPRKRAPKKASAK